ncbi:MAG: DUF86 domain-containing protein [Nitrospirae bacterium]|nr:DUF86 domain-containing protein [Nitrospirota bacterium]
MKDRNYTDYINDILTSIKEVDEFTKGMTPDDFYKDRKTINAVIRSLEVLGEASGKISDDIKSKAPNIPWGKMTGMRNKLIHEYFGVDLEIVWTVIKEDLPPIKPLIEQLAGEIQ